MDIAFVNRPLGMRRGGGEIWDLEMAKALSALGERVTLYVGRPLFSELCKNIDLPLVEVPSPFLYDLGYRAPTGIGGVITDFDRQGFITQLKRYLQSQHDIIHLNGFPEMLRLAKGQNTPYTIKLNGPPHSLFYDYIHPTKSSYTWLQYAEEVVTTGVTTDVVRERTSIEPTVVNPGVDTTKFTPNGTQKDTKGPTVLWVGRFVPAKNLKLLVNAFVELKREYPEAKLWLVGEGGRRKKIEAYVREKGVEDDTTFFGYIPNEDLPQFYRGSDVFVLSSKTENHPISLMEAMSCGRPVVAPEIGWIPKMVDDGVDGLTVSPGEPKSLSSALIEGLENGELLGDNARQKAAREFSWDTRAGNLLSIFRQVTRN